MEKLNFKTAFKYPFNRAIGMWNILWLFVPIIGWLIVGGYTIRIIQEFSKGNFKELPILNFKKDLKLGFFMFFKSLPFIITYILFASVLIKISPWLRFITIPFEIFILPIMAIHFFNKKTINSLFEFSITKPVFNNLKDYLEALLKSALLGLIFGLMIVILIGIPAGTFTKNIFLADFYRRKIAPLNQ